MTSIAQDAIAVVAAATQEKAARVTIKSTLTARDVPALSGVLLAMLQGEYAAQVKALPEGVSSDTVVSVEKAAKDLGKVFADAIKMIPETIKAQAAELAAQKAAEEQRKAKEKEEAEKALLALQAEVDAKRKVIVDTLIAQGLPESVAVASAKNAVPDAKAEGKPVAQYERVTVVVEGKEYQMPVRGNITNEIRELMKNSGLEREAFIKKYQKA